MAGTLALGGLACAHGPQLLTRFLQFFEIGDWRGWFHNLSMGESDNLQVESHERGLIIRLRGRGIFEQKQETVQAITDTIKQHKARATLIDLQAVPGPFPFMDRYQVGELVARFFTGLTVAALISEAQAGEERIGTLVAANRGVPVPLFTNPTAAESWLKRHSDSQPTS